MLVLRSEDLEGSLALGVASNRRAGEPDDRRLGHGGHQVRAEVLRNGSVRLVDEDVDVVAHAAVLPDLLELVDHRHDQAAEVAVEEALQRHQYLHR